jgi:hypothetical protein
MPHVRIRGGGYEQSSSLLRLLALHLDPLVRAPEMNLDHARLLNEIGAVADNQGAGRFL